MKVLIGIKLVVDANVKIRVRADGSGVETAGLLVRRPVVAAGVFSAVTVSPSVR